MPEIGPVSEGIADSAPYAAAASSGRFVWPPRRIPGSAPPAGPAVSIDFPGTGETAWGQIERVWLEVTSQPLARRCQQAGWSPDPPAAYCHRCGQTVGGYGADAEGCWRCRERSVPWARLIRLGEYRPPVSDFIREIKYTAFRRLAVDLGRLLGESIAAAIREARVERQISPDRPVVVVPVPTSFRRRVARGVDHAAVMARAAARACEASFRPCLRRAHRPAQVSMSAAQRARNVAGTMRPRLGASIIDRWRTSDPPHVVLVDDVTTTGATLREACRSVRSLYGSTTALWCAVAAVTPVAGEGSRGGPDS